MNIKNKILLTLIAIILAICLFNTNCFASTYEDLGLPELPSVEGATDYEYFIYTDHNENKNITYLYLVYATDDFSNYDNFTKFKFIDDTYSRKLSIYNLTDKTIFSKQYKLSSSKWVDNYGDMSINSGTSIGRHLSYATITPKYTSLNVLDSNGEIYFEPIERGTEDNTNPDSGETGDETTGTDSENTTDSDDSGGILSSITQGFKNVIDFFTQLVEFVGNILSYLNPFSDNFILKGVIDFLGEILSYINPFSENFFVYKLIDLLGDLFEFLFIPNENSFTGIIDIVKSKFDFIDTIKISANSLKDLISNVGTAPKLIINVNNNKYGVEQVTLIDLEWYKPYKTYGDLVLTGFIYAFFLWRLFISIPNILHGFGGSVQDSYKISEIKGGKN